MKLATLAVALGLAENATEAACLAALETLRAEAVPLAVHEATVAQLTATAGDLATLRAEVRQGKVDSLVDEALKAKKIMPAEREKYAELCATDAGLATVEQLFATMTTRLPGSGLDGRRAPDSEAPMNPAQLAAAARKIADEAWARGENMSMAAAVAAVMEVRA